MPHWPWNPTRHPARTSPDAVVTMAIGWSSPTIRSAKRRATASGIFGLPGQVAEEEVVALLTDLGQREPGERVAVRRPGPARRRSAGGRPRRSGARVRRSSSSSPSAISSPSSAGPPSVSTRRWPRRSSSSSAARRSTAVVTDHDDVGVLATPASIASAEAARQVEHDRAGAVGPGEQGSGPVELHRSGDHRDRRSWVAAGLHAERRPARSVSADRPVALGPDGARPDQHHVGLGPQLLEQRPVRVVRQAGHPSADGRRPVEPGDHVGDDPAVRRAHGSPMIALQALAQRPQLGPQLGRLDHPEAEGQVDEEAGHPVDVAADAQTAPLPGRFEHADRDGDLLERDLDRARRGRRRPAPRARAARGPR